MVTVSEAHRTYSEALRVGREAMSASGVEHPSCLPVVKVEGKVLQRTVRCNPLLPEQLSQ